MNTSHYFHMNSNEFEVNIYNHGDFTSVMLRRTEGGAEVSFFIRDNMKAKSLASAFASIGDCIVKDITYV